ncbi:hypothetical protein PIB30_080817 [Stylosanthes scabra]|uniref:Uncharacterized protein n=1 Tax=Stylosanthes scabra TaxID=79078 RepID=A0ABU6RSF0_9FABA|nr:hypothetical protein [Stylosanthes scabra]
MKRGVMELETVDALLAQNKSMAQQLSALNKKLEKLEVFAVGTQSSPFYTCGICGGPHESNHCSMIQDDQSSIEQVNYLGNQPRPPQNDPYSNTYNQETAAFSTTHLSSTAAEATSGHFY